MATLEIQRSGPAEVRLLAREELGVDANALAEAHHVGVDPPAALLGEKLISEAVRERRRRSLAEALGLINEDLVLRDKVGGVADPHAGGDDQVRIVRIEIDRVPPIDERPQAKQLVGGERSAVPERLKSVLRGVASALIARAVTRVTAASAPSTASASEAECAADSPRAARSSSTRTSIMSSIGGRNAMSTGFVNRSRSYVGVTGSRTSTLRCGVWSG